MAKIKYILIIIFLHCTPVMAVDISQADRQFALKQYTQAKEGYLEAAKVGNPHAYFQLARMYFKGLGVEADLVNALLYYSLAAEYDFLNSVDIVNGAIDSLSSDAQVQIRQAMVTYKRNFGKERINQKLFPLIDKKLLDQKVTFDGKARLEENFDTEDFIDDSFEDLGDSFLGDDDAFGSILSTQTPPFLIIDIDIASDGSIRHYSDVQGVGRGTRRLAKAFTQYSLPQPFFKGGNVDFIHRAHLGAATFNKSRFRSERADIYHKVRRIAKKLRNSTLLKDQYEYAMALLAFKWLSQEEGEAQRKLLEVAKQGYPAAMYEYGMILYREQKNIEDAIYWIGAASKYGLPEAEYRLGKILQTSPWVARDNKKALFWFNSAAKKAHLSATIRSIDIKLTSDDVSLIDVDGAVSDLNAIENSHDQHPEYYYLLALSYMNREERDYSLARSNLRTAISRGKENHWNVSRWQALLESLSSGTVTSCESSDDFDYDCVEQP